ncbi:uncharacterized protein LOC129409798 [Boleophthalmus pectinirostris]|uniref:uncharacterized protein LOC129409798 n=1 Tax=Boleophthalmus pectinirostris TaxID=150288 RepID=UPI00242BB5F0|nr:uncharacterized protein LOC129409798 [Boleophthalmus pectinirostris]
MYHLIEFTINKTVAVAPANWVNDGVCLWPPYSKDGRVTRAAKTQEVPGEDWDEFDVRIIKTCAHYLEARQALNKALTCATSDLQSEDEMVPPKRKRKPIHYFGDTDEDSDLEIPHRRKKQIPPPPVPPPPVPPPSSAPVPEPATIEEDAHPAPSNSRAVELVEVTCLSVHIGKLATIGGQDPKCIVRSILAHILADRCACKISWKGSNEKMPFKDLALKTLVLQAAKKNNLCRGITDVEVFQHCIRWFNLAADRGQGRKRPSPSPTP